MWWVAANVNIDDLLNSRPGGFIRCGGVPAGMAFQYSGELRWADPSLDTGPSLSEMARDHRARMAADHAETMRQAKIGTWLLVAFVVAAGFAVANLLGGIG